MLFPALAKAKTKAQGIGCLSNTKQITLAWHLYSGDSNDHVANNYGVNETVDAINRKVFDNWVNNVMTWGAGNGTADVSNTNRDWVVNGVLGRYTAGAIALKMRADKYLSSAQNTARYSQRNRGISAHEFNLRPVQYRQRHHGPKAWGKIEGFSQYRQYLKQSEVPHPSKTWLVLDEHPDSINDGYFINNPTATAWQDLPASYHNGPCGFSFRQTSEIKKWLSASSKYRFRDLPLSDHQELRRGGPGRFCLVS